MNYLSELPECVQRFGRMNIEFDDAGKKTVKPILACGFREVDFKECRTCKGTRTGIRRVRS